MAWKKHTVNVAMVDDLVSSYIWSSLLLLHLLVVLGCDQMENTERERVSWELEYKSTSENWERFLKCWSDEILAQLSSSEQNRHERREVVRRGTLGYLGADRSEIRLVEDRLGFELPISYIHFLKVSNGWTQIGFDAEDEEILPIAQIDTIRSLAPAVLEDWFEDYDPLNMTFVVSDSEYAIYGPEQNPTSMRLAYLESSVVISSPGADGMYLINPSVKTDDGELEVWFFSSRVPGAIRFRSFGELMVNAYILATGRKNYLYPYAPETFTNTCASEMHFDVKRRKIED